MGRQKYPQARVYPINHGNRGQAYLIIPDVASANKRGGLRDMLTSHGYCVACSVAICLRANMTGLVMRSFFT